MKEELLREFRRGDKVLIKGWNIRAIVRLVEHDDLHLESAEMGVPLPYRTFKTKDVEYILPLKYSGTQ